MTYLLTEADKIYAALNGIVELAARRYNLNIKLGYIGNLTRTSDDRSWRIWVDGVNDRHQFGNTFMVDWGTPTDRLPELLEAVENGLIEEAISRISWGQHYTVDVKDYSGLLTHSAENNTHWVEWTQQAIDQARIDEFVSEVV